MSKNSPVKKQNSLSVTHTEFMNFLEPFCSTITEKRYKELLEETDYSEAINEEYKKHDKILRSKLCNCIVLNKSVSELSSENNLLSNDLLSINYSSDLTLSNYSGFSKKESDFFKKNELLNCSYLQEYIDSVKKSNKNKKIIEEKFQKRIQCSAYFKLYDTIYKELLAIFSKKILRRKKKSDDFEDEILKEYLKRYEEFIEEFGEPEQFSDQEMIYEDLLVGDCDSYIE